MGETPCRCGRCQLGASCFQPGQNRRSPLGSTGGCFTAIRPTSPGAAGSVGHSCRIKGAPQQARVLAALRAAPACRGRFAPLTRHPFGFCPSPFAGSIPLRGPRLVPSIIAPGHTSLGPLLHLPERGIAPRCLTAPAWGRLSCCRPWCVKPRVRPSTWQRFRQASETPIEAFSRPCRPLGVFKPLKTRYRPAVAVWLRLFEWKGCQGLHRKPHAERRAKPEHRTGEDAGEANP